jgi:tetratricopeptide (TPR) repeat protein
MDALCDGDGVTAERLLKAALKIEPDAPDLMNNLGAAYELQGLHDQSRRLVREIHERWPDYFFGRVGVANQLINEKKFEAARTMIEPLLQKTRLHHTEFSALCSCYIRLLVAEDNLEAAISWSDLWQQTQPDHPDLELIGELLELAEMTGTIDKFAGKKGARNWWRR